jgi:transcriptional regulator with XRE-family HTH domain
MSIVEQRFSARRTGPTAGSRQLSTEDWELRVGDQLRRSRLAANLDQAQLAGLADISVGALRGLERGSGSTLRTLVRVIRALGREDWLDGISPAVGVSPIEVLRSGAQPRSRVYRARPSAADAPSA